MRGHSPGPWRVLSDGSIWTDQPGPHGTAPHGSEICQVTRHRTSCGEYWREEDARLIAAAPELLKALEDAVDRCGCHRVEPQCFDCDKDQALIRKVRGMNEEEFVMVGLTALAKLTTAAAYHARLVQAVKALLAWEPRAEANANALLRELGEHE